MPFLNGASATERSPFPVTLLRRVFGSELTRCSFSQRPVRSALIVQPGYETHKTGFREITYRWRPWQGQRVLVRGEARRAGIVVLQCVRDELKGFPTLEIPVWMFDSDLCGEMKPTELPRVDCAALLALKHLLSAVRDRVNGTWYKRSMIPAVQEMLMRKPLLSRIRQGELFSPPAKLPELPAEVRQKMARLLARMLNEQWLHRSTVVRPEVGNE